MTFFNEVGKIALGSRVRLLAEKIGSDATVIYQAYGTNLQPKWFPVFYALSKRRAESGTEIARQIGHSHASVSKIISEMSKAGLVLEKSDANDGRRTVIALSKKGESIARKIEPQYTDVGAALEDLIDQSTHNLWEALAEWEQLLAKKSLRERVLEKKKQRELASVKIEPYQPKHKTAFRKLNEEWIKRYFKLEKPDRDSLSDPKGYILDRGGFIFVAKLDGEVAGVCALIKRDDINAFELAKMAVSPKARGKNIGFLLGRAAIEKAKALKTPRLFLESNTVLTPAINLYYKLGFKKIEGPPTPYERCNIQMELKLGSDLSY